MVVLKSEISLARDVTRVCYFKLAECKGNGPMGFPFISGFFL
jgi:hypothetical protein